MDLEFHNLSYSVQNRGLRGRLRTRHILKNVSGRFQSGHLSAIMGPSGAGKSSLLNAISGFRSSGVSGELLVNGRPRDNRDFHRASCYITQEDLHQPLLSVREAMNVAARLKMQEQSQGTAANTVTEILRNIGLLPHEHTRTEDLSGGQRKRLSIALELVNNPPVFFLDEPTSGLDTVTTSQCVRLLHQLAKQGRTVVATIHQPSASLIEMFDQVYVIANGQCIYQGDTSAMVPFLSSVGLHCPMHYNPADFIIEATENPTNITHLSEAVDNGRSFKSITGTNDLSSSNLLIKINYDKKPPEKSENPFDALQEVQFHQRKNSSSSLTSQISNISSTMAWLKVRRMSTDSNFSYPTSTFAQVKILLLRMFIQIFRNTTGLWIQLIHHVLCGILIGLCFYGTADDGEQMFNHLKFCIGVVIFFTYTQLMVPVLRYPQEVKLVKKEFFNRWYGLTSYYIALTVSRLPIQMVLNIVFCMIVYLMSGLPRELMRFSLFCIVGCTVSLVAEGMGLAIGSIYSVTNGCAIGPTSIAPFLGLAIYGFDFAKNIPWVMNIVMKMSFLRCGVVAMVLTVFGFSRKPLGCADVYCHFSKPDVLLDYLDIDKSSVWLEILSMLGIMFVFRSISFIGLKWRFSG